jgi:hypothetical protein
MLCGVSCWSEKSCHGSDAGTSADQAVNNLCSGMALHEIAGQLAAFGCNRSECALGAQERIK